MAGDQPSFSGPRLPWDTSALEFDDVVMEVFPLRANPYRLETFCQRYLNHAPEIAEFRPSLPFVMMAAIHYPKMTHTETDLGWVSQNEVAFSVPLEWRRNGGPWGQNWASVSPFIFVDSERSTLVGREVFGWPKVLAEFRPGPKRWRPSANSRRPLLTLETLMFSELYAGQPLEPRTLLQIQHRPPPSLLRFPPDFPSLVAPAVRWPASVLDLTTAALDAQTRALLASIRGVIKALSEKGEPSADTVNLKQFRATDPTEDGSASNSACYQALTSSRLVFKNYHASGLLGDSEVLRGDLSGGYEIQLRRNHAYPIVDALGLKVTEEAPTESAEFATVRPVLPYWVKADIRYDRAQRLAWRAEGRVWSTGTDLPAEDPDNNPTPYITTLGPVAQPIEGPFDFRDATVRLIPLRARRKKLLDFVSAHLSRLTEEAEIDLVPMGSDSMVLLMVSSYGQLSAPANDVGWWARRRLAFTVPVIITPKDPDKVPPMDPNKAPRKGDEPATERPSFPALFWPYVFSDSPIAVTTGREFTGMPTEFAKLSEGVDPWLQTDWHGERHLMTLSTKEYPALGVGQEEVERVLIEIAEVESVGGEELKSSSRTRRESERPPGSNVAFLEDQELAAPISAASTPADRLAECRWMHALHPDLVADELKAQPSRPISADGPTGGHPGVAPVDPHGPPTAPPDDKPPGVAGPTNTDQNRWVVSGLYIDNILLKQFRDAENLNQACYQAVVLSKTQIGRWHGEGDWPEVHFAERDYEVRIHDYRGRPIVEDLGLIPDRRTTGPQGTPVTIHRSEVTEDGNGPAWLQADLREDPGRTLFWRTLGGKWQTKNGMKPIRLAAQSDVGWRSLHSFLRAVLTRIVHFRAGDTELLPGPKRRIKEVGRVMKKDSRLVAHVTGHAHREDARNLSTSDEIKIGQKRADAVRSYLEERFSIARERITTESMGSDAAYPDHIEAALQRRAEITVGGPAIPQPAPARPPGKRSR